MQIVGFLMTWLILMRITFGQVYVLTLVAPILNSSLKNKTKERYKIVLVLSGLLFCIFEIKLILFYLFCFIVRMATNTKIDIQYSYGYSNNRVA